MAVLRGARRLAYLTSMFRLLSADRLALRLLARVFRRCPPWSLALLVGAVQAGEYKPLRGEVFDRAGFLNPHTHIPAQCYVETSGGTQNACLFCHTDGVWKKRLGNNNPQAGANPNVGNLQAEYAFGSYNLQFCISEACWLGRTMGAVLPAPTLGPVLHQVLRCRFDCSSNSSLV